jgi:dTDP-4-amino-4,6-dideoxygalactose transaminase
MQKEKERKDLSMSNHLNPDQTQSIPFLDLVTLHSPLRDALTAAFQKALSTASFIGGPAVEGFEAAFAKFCETRYCVGVGSGTDALRFALTTSGIKAGDAVITVPNTFIATTEGITQAGAHPKFVDVDERTFNMDPAKLLEYLEQECTWDEVSGSAFTRKDGQRVTAVVPVHLYGQPADMDPILEIAERFRLIVVEDACQAHGASYFSARNDRWMKAGSLGRAAAFSFYPGKNLGACGEAGAITTNDENIARQCRMIRDHGQAKKYYHDVEGYNGRLDAIQAEFLRIKLVELPRWNEQRRERAQIYAELLAELDEGKMLPIEAPWAKSVYHLFVLRVQNRDDLIAKLAAEHIGTGIHYPIPLHLQKAYAHLGHKEGDFPVSESLAKGIISLPMFPSLTAQQQQLVCEQIHKILRETTVRQKEPRTEGVLATAPALQA